MPSAENWTDAFSSLEDYSVAGFTLGRALSALLLLLVCLLVDKLLLKAIDKTLARTPIARSLHAFLKATAKAILIFLTVLIVAGSLGIPVTSLIAVLSVAGLAVSLAIQNTLSNVAGGIQILASHPFEVGDYIEAGSTSGTVAEIGIIYTKLRSPDNKLIQIPNREIAEEKIVNFSAESNRRVDLKFTTSYDAPAETVKGAIRRVIDAHEKILREPEPFVRVSGYGDSSIEYTVRVWCANGDYWEVYFDLMEQVKSAFDEAGVEMTYPHLNIHMQ